LDFNGFQIKDLGGAGMSNLEAGSLYYEMSKYDASVATYVLVHMLGVQSVGALGDEDQKKRLIPESMALN
jgi:alkylation response protein AidB-like acyl-CoA dehydrogenase